MKRALLVLLTALAASCFSPREPACAFSCASDGKCPTDYVCASDNLCHRADGKGICTLDSPDAGPDSSAD